MSEVVSDRHKTWFYVPDYPGARVSLHAAYQRYGVEEWACEPAGVQGREHDADVTVRARLEARATFLSWLRNSGIEGLEIEGQPVRSDNVYAYPRIRAATDWIARKARAAYVAVRYGSAILI